MATNTEDSAAWGQRPIRRAGDWHQGERLAAYTPDCLSYQEWTASKAVVLAAVEAAQPASDAMALDYASHLCAFLEACPEWDHQSPPDLNVLVHEGSITHHDERLADRGKSASTRDKARGALRRVARALRGGPPHLRQWDSRRDVAFVLGDAELTAKARRCSRAWPRNGDAVSLALQIGAGLPASVAVALRPDQVDVTCGTVLTNGRTLAVLQDVTPYLPAAVAALSTGPALTEAEGLLHDKIARPLWLLTHLRAGTPLALVNDVSQFNTGSPLQRHELERLLPHLQLPTLGEITANAGAKWWRTVPTDSMAALRVLTASPTVGSPEVLLPMELTARPDDRPVRRQRRPSRAAMLRSAKQAQAAGQTSLDPLHLDLELVDVPGWSTLPHAVRRRIADYRPLRVDPDSWAEVERPARRLLVLAAPCTVRKVNVLGCHLAPYLVWANEHLEHKDVREFALDVLQETTLDRYTDEAMIDAPRGTTATRRSEVRGALRAARPGPHPERLSYRPVRPPYTSSAVATHKRLARNQPTPAGRRGLGFIVGAGYGGGLDGRDMSGVRACDVFTRTLPDGTTAMLIRVRGSRPRTVVVRQEFAALLAEAVALHLAEGRGRRGLMLGTKPGRRQVTSPVLARLMTADGRALELEVARMRSTWLISHMSAPVPLGVLLVAAGLRSARALVDLLPYTAVPDDATAIQLLRGHRGLLPTSLTEQENTA